MIIQRRAMPPFIRVLARDAGTKPDPALVRLCVTSNHDSTERSPKSGILCFGARRGLAVLRPVVAVGMSGKMPVSHWPVDRPRDWVKVVNATVDERASIRCVRASTAASRMDLSNGWRRQPADWAWKSPFASPEGRENSKLMIISDVPFRLLAHLEPIINLPPRRQECEGLRNLVFPFALFAASR